jgi:hypothetical protein
MTLHLSIGELIASLPEAIGERPRNSVVAVSVNQLGLPTCVLAVDRAVLLDPESAGFTAAAVAEELAVEQAQLAVLVTYAESDVRSGCDALEALRLEVEFVVPHVELVAVSGDRWFRPGCTEPGCCPPGGRRLPPVPDFVPGLFATARARAELSARAASRVAARRDEREQAAHAWDDALSSGSVSDAALARRLAASLDDLCVRDWVVLRILGADDAAAEDALDGLETGSVALALDDALAGAAVPDRLATERARAVVERVARGARGKRRQAAAHTLVGVVDWWEGNLAGARERCDRALAADHTYRLAELVRLAASRGIAPGWVRSAGQSV